MKLNNGAIATANTSHTSFHWQQQNQDQQNAVKDAQGKKWFQVKFCCSNHGHNTSHINENCNNKMLDKGHPWIAGATPTNTKGGNNALADMFYHWFERSTRQYLPQPPNGRCWRDVLLGMSGGGWVMMCAVQLKISLKFFAVIYDSGVHLWKPRTPVRLSRSWLDFNCNIAWDGCVWKQLQMQREPSSWSWSWSGLDLVPSWNLKSFQDQTKINQDQPMIRSLQLTQMHGFNSKHCRNQLNTISQLKIVKSELKKSIIISSKNK